MHFVEIVIKSYIEVSYSLHIHVPVSSKTSNTERPDEK